MKKIILLPLFVTVVWCANAQEKVNFDNAFQKANHGKYRVEIPPLKELLHIMLAITESGRNNDDMVNRQGGYYQDVVNYFKPFANEPIIKTFDSLLKVSLYHYIFITGNAMVYDLSGTRLRPTGNYIFPARSVANMTLTTNPLDTYKKEIEAFAKKSRFQHFYRAHKAYYAGVIADYESGANLGKQWKWLEKNFKTTINNYLVLCSPLINGLNYTSEFHDKGFRQIMMVLPPLDHDPKLSAIQNELLNTRVMFSEIDHNYVDPPSLAHKPAIDSVCSNRAVWVNDKTEGTYAYPTPVKVFNEYMTYAVFVLYCKDNYQAAQYEETRRNVIGLMNARGFPKMEAFVTALEKVRSEVPGQKIDDLYTPLLERLRP